MAQIITREQALAALDQCGNLSYIEMVNLIYSIVFVLDEDAPDFGLLKFRGLWQYDEALEGKYDFDTYATYNNALYRSAINNNTSIPGLDTNWVPQGAPFASFDPVTVNNGGILPIHATPAWLFVGPGTFNKPEGGTITTTANLNVIATNGTTYSLLLAVPLNLTDYLTKAEFIAKTPFNNYAPHVTDIDPPGFTTVTPAFDNLGKETVMLGYNRGTGFTASFRAKIYPVISPFAVGSSIFLGFILTKIAPYTKAPSCIFQFYNASKVEQTLERITLTIVDNGDSTFSYTGTKVIPAGIAYFSFRIDMPGENPATTLYQKILISKLVVSSEAINFSRSYSSTFINEGGILLATVPYVTFGAGGSDGNPGSYDYPLATLPTAIARVGGAGRITIKGGDYKMTAGVNIAGCRNLEIVPEKNKRVRLMYGEFISAATLVSGSTKVYSLAHAVPGGRPELIYLPYVWLWQHDVNDPRSIITPAKRHPLHRGKTHRLESCKVTWKASVAALEATVDGLPYFYWDAGVLYFTLTAGTNLTDNPMVIPSGNSAAANYMIFGGTGLEYIKMTGIEILYAATNLKYCTYNLIDCAFRFIAGDGGMLYGNSIGSRVTTCEVAGVTNAVGSGGDGFNGTTTEFATSNSIFAKMHNVYFENNWAHDCFDDGQSCHGYCEETVNCGLYEANGNGITPASGAHATYTNLWVRDNTFTGISAQGGPVDGGTSTNAVCYNCISEGNNENFRSSDNANGVNLIAINCVSRNPGLSGYGTYVTKINSVEL